LSATILGGITPARFANTTGNVFGGFTERDTDKLRNNSALGFALKGRGFKPRRKCHEIKTGFSR
jgi:hypothetical protein